MPDYDIYLRHGAVNGGEWAGFLLARKGLGGVEGLGARPYLGWTPWLLDPAAPDDPIRGSWGVQQWRLDLALMDGLVTLRGGPAYSGATPTGMRALLRAYMGAGVIYLQDVDGAVYVVAMTGYEEREVEPFTAEHPDGGWAVRVELAKAG